MRNRGYGYGAYRGRSRSRTVLKVIIAVLVLVLILVGGCYLVLERFGVYGSDGSFHLDLPFARTSPTPEPEETEPLVVVSSEPEPTPSPTPELEEVLHAVELPRSALTDGTAQSQVEAAGGNAAVFDMKADDGSLGYVSSVALAVSTGASADDETLNQAIQTLNSGDLYTVARVSCFRDNTVPYNEPSLGVKTNKNYNFRDADDIRWMSATSAEARQYVTDLCLELAGLGFDEILLDNSGYPTSGYLNTIKVGDAYDSSQFSTVVSAFYAQVKAALEARYPDVKLSVVTDQGVLRTGSDADSGQTLAALAAGADRVWADLGDMTMAEAQAALAAAGMSGECLVPIAAQAGTAAGSWAILN